MNFSDLNLQGNPLFAGVARHELAPLFICLNARTRVYAKNQFVLLEGDPADRIGIVLNGNLQILKEDYFGARNIIANVGPNELFGEAFAAAEIGELPLSVIATEESRLMLIDYRAILTTCGQNCAYHYALIRNLIRIIAKKNLGLIQKIEHVSKRTTREKVLSYLSAVAKENHSDSFVIPFSRQELADYLCVDRTALSAVISKLQSEGILEFKRSHFTLHHHLDSDAPESFSLKRAIADD